MTDKVKLLAPIQWCYILIGFSVPISVALDNVLLALILLGMLPSLGGIARIVTWHPVARASWMLFSALLIAMFYGPTALTEAFSVLAKYIDLLFVPIFIFLLYREETRRRARYAFLLAMGITLVLSYLVGMKLIPVMSWMSGFAEPGNPVIFFSHITQNNMMGFAVFLALLESREAQTLPQRAVWAAFALLGTVNVLFMVQGRTGYLIILILLFWFAWSSLARFMRRLGKAWGWRQAVIVLLAFALWTFATFHISSRMHERMEQVISDYQAWTPDHGQFTSTGQRLDFYSNTLQIVRQHPWFGIGTGGFPAAYLQQIQGKDVTVTNNPHNEYLMLSVQTGLLGLGLLLYLFYAQWRTAPLLPTAFEQDGARGLMLAYAANCSLNSALMDHADGLFFAFMTAAMFAGLQRGSARA